VKYAFILEHAAVFAITTMASVFGVSTSGFYAWRKRQEAPSKRAEKRLTRDKLIKHHFDEHKGRSGSPRLVEDLRDSGHACDRKTVAESMKRQNLRAKAARKFKVTTDSNHHKPVFENLLEQDFEASRPNEKWVQDMTYIWTGRGWLYLAIVLDLYSRKVIGWSMSERMKADLVCDALQMAIWSRGSPRGVTVHSDRGSQYCSDAYRQLLKQYQLKGSMSGVGNCYDNAVAESFFHSLKVEEVHGSEYETRKIAKQAVFEYIEIYYNQQRRHSANGLISPHAYEAMKKVA